MSSFQGHITCQLDWKSSTQTVKQKMRKNYYYLSPGQICHVCYDFQLTLEEPVLYFFFININTVAKVSTYWVYGIITQIIELLGSSPRCNDSPEYLCNHNNYFSKFICPSSFFFCFVDIVDLRASIAQSATSVYQTLITTVNG